METIRNPFTLICAFVLATACATVQEKQAYSDWNEEAQKWSYSNEEEVDLPELDENASLDDYVLYAMLNNSGQRAAFDRWKAALDRVAPSQTLPDPRFTYANYVREVETRVGAQENKFGLAQTFPWFGKLDLQGDMALQAAHAEQQRYEAVKLDLIFRIKNIYYEYAYLAEAIAITESNLTLLSYLEGVAQTKYKSGAGFQSAVIKAQVELGKLEDRLYSLQDLMRPMATKMNMALNRPSNMPLPAPKGLPQEEPAFVDDDLFILLRENNPNLKAFEYMTAREDLAIQLAGKNYFPDMTLGVDYIDTASRTDANPVDNGKDPIVAMLSINVPIWQQKYDAITAEARARHRAVVREKKEKENSLIADLEMALFELRDADRKIDLYRNTLLPKAEQSVKVTELAFTADKATFLDLIDSQRILLGFQLEYQRALADRAQRVAEIEMLTGGDMVPKPSAQSNEEK